ncbi:hypothetical protein CPB86DRAFT_802494 [Serendipita vermifera]|nr:hypothetical protein CPB86DRAFT_802494 [Serendipita vermifera]
MPTPSKLTNVYTSESSMVDIGTVWRMIWDFYGLMRVARRPLVELGKRVIKWMRKGGKRSMCFRLETIGSRMDIGTGSVVTSLCNQVVHHRGGREDHCANATRDVLAFYPSVHSVASIPHPTQLGKRKVLLHTLTGHVGERDHVIMTYHFTTFEILKRGDNNKGGGVREEEKMILGGFKWTCNSTVLHSEFSALSRSQQVQCAWNYVTRSEVPSVKGPGRTNRDEFALVDGGGGVLDFVPVEGVRGDSFLTLEEIIKLDLPKAEFVFLSACQTTTRLRMKQCISQVECSSPDIKDYLARELADEFYRHIMVGKGRPESRKAVEAIPYSIKRLREKEGFTFTSWIPFVHLGI